jgi:Zn-dependent M28 family amino/carboxypeptidase
VNKIQIMRVIIIIFFISILSGCAVRKPENLIVKSDVSRVVQVLSSDAMEGRASFSPGIARAADFISAEFKAAGLSFFENESYHQFFKSKDGRELFNVVGVLKGKSKPEEFVIFSAHYDHLGIVKPIGLDSIANGADDDASGVAAVIALAKAYSKLNNNERTLIFVAFTAEEIGGFGSKYFSTRIDPEAIKAMINFEMIGKDSKFGPNSVFITGFERSDLGKLMQERVKGTDFDFYPDPYPEQRLFFRSDNATLARLGVPAHSFSTVQIPTDSYYHTVKDEFETLDVDNIVSTINAIFIGASGLVDGSETPSRITIQP